MRKLIDGFDNYMIDSDGYVINIKTNRILKTTKNHYGYESVKLFKNNIGMTVYVHRLVGIYFLPNPYKLPQLNHIDEDKSNNSLNNLEWCDSLYNSNYGTRSKRIAESNSRVIQCVETGEIDKVINFCKKYHYNRATLCGAANPNQRTKTAYGYHWIRK